MPNTTDPHAPMYTVKECLVEIKAIDDEVRNIRRAPAQQSVSGDFVSFAGRLAELRAERREWKSRLDEAKAYEYETKASGMQGPERLIE